MQPKGAWSRTTELWRQRVRQRNLDATRRFVRVSVFAGWGVGSAMRKSSKPGVAARKFAARRSVTHFLALCGNGALSPQTSYQASHGSTRRQRRTSLIDWQSAQLLCAQPTRQKMQSMRARSKPWRKIPARAHVLRATLTDNRTSSEASFSLCSRLPSRCKQETP